MIFLLILYNMQIVKIQDLTPYYADDDHRFLENIKAFLILAMKLLIPLHKTSASPNIAIRFLKNKQL